MEYETLLILTKVLGKEQFRAQKMEELRVFYVEQLGEIPTSENLEAGVKRLSEIGRDALKNELITKRIVSIYHEVFGEGYEVTAEHLIDGRRYLGDFEAFKRALVSQDTVNKAVLIIVLTSLL